MENQRDPNGRGTPFPALRVPGDPGADALLAAELPGLGWRLGTYGGRLDPAALPPAACLVVDVGDEATLSGVLEIADRRPELQLVVLAGKTLAPVVEKRLGDRGAEILRLPLDALDLRMAARRCLRRVEATGHRDRRFDTADQMMSQIGPLIGRLARDVQGDVRYFNELAYYVSVHDADLRLVGANAVHREQFGDLRGRPSWEIYSGETGRRDSCPEGKVVATRGKVSTDAVVRYRNGREEPVRVHAAPIFDASGKVDMVLEVFAGAREIDRLAADIRSTQRRYRQLFNAVPNYIVVLDRKKRLTAFNNRFMQDFGFKTGRLFHDLFRPVSPTRRETPIDRTLRDGVAHRGEMLLRSPSGERLTLMAWTSPIKTAAGKLLEVLTIFTDLTEMRRLQDNLSHLGLMISTISHSLRGSLTGMDAALYLVDKGFYRDKPGRIEEGLELATLMTDRIRKLVRDILYYAKERDLEPETTDAEDFAHEIAGSVRSRILGADIRFRPQVASPLGSVDIDTGLMRSALVNLLDNAVEACIVDETHPEPHEIAFTAEGDDRWVTFVISDNGIGMNPEEMDNMFKLFWSSKGVKGTGLGLFITRKVIRQHGGTIEAASRPGEGAVFTVRIPRSQS